MDFPGLRNFGDVALAAINAATAATVITSTSDRNGQPQAYVDRLEGALAAAIEANFTWGSGAGTLKADIFTTLTQGQTWIHVGRFGFAAASANKIINLSALTPRLAAYVPVTLADDVGLDGVFGDRFRASILKAGDAYAGNTSLALRAHFR